MQFSRIGCLSLAIAVVSSASTLAQEVRYFEKDGITYKETVRKVTRPVYETRYENREQTVYRERYTTEVREQRQIRYAPVTQYQWASCMRGRWNPFIQPYYTHHLVPVRSYQAQEHIVRLPVTRRELVPEKRTVQTPITTQRVAQEEVITRVAVSSRPTTSTAVAGRPVVIGQPIYGTPITGVGGVARMQSDPPRQATRWQAVGTSIKRY